ncbi:uncharacterized protein SPPG_06205 [Spizellomyces punctatus DAOM BR117]|uniref:Cep192-like domain-containing protein n=1 Tax=Spizellomyces punctatus (strain DAOM BR117) TaxID=645134 RepID=A0A0L0HCN3_SPIPD|nr:uncharacterized protein SPPG_06205 [Spizellomyces punctatus DAOM BR117]KNC98508.1 hypothetical protein SPPG_06205 [Spizellomyces punctatus DAOM BR117]|eukprot:XP_016606548.1 hypothetical protein SPPG_06205 [Spizellomyces punctatus DAOM BR117]
MIFIYYLLLAISITISLDMSVSPEPPTFTIPLDRLSHLDASFDEFDQLAQEQEASGLIDFGQFQSTNILDFLDNSDDEDSDSSPEQSEVLFVNGQAVSPGAFFASRSATLGSLEEKLPAQFRPHWTTPRIDEQGRYIDLLPNTPETPQGEKPPEEDNTLARILNSDETAQVKWYRPPSPSDERFANAPALAPAAERLTQYFKRQDALEAAKTPQWTAADFPVNVVPTPVRRLAAELRNAIPNSPPRPITQITQPRPQHYEVILPRKQRYGVSSFNGAESSRFISIQFPSVSYSTRSHVRIALDLNNISNIPANWSITSIGPVYMAPVVRQGKPLRNNEKDHPVKSKVFEPGTASGCVMPHTTQSVSISFRPPSAGRYRQTWHIRANSQVVVLSLEALADSKPTKKVEGRRELGLAEYMRQKKVDIMEELGVAESKPVKIVEGKREISRKVVSVREGVSVDARPRIKREPVASVRPRPVPSKQVTTSRSIVPVRPVPSGEARVRTKREPIAPVRTMPVPPKQQVTTGKTTTIKTRTTSRQPVAVPQKSERPRWRF